MQVVGFYLTIPGDGGDLLVPGGDPLQHISRLQHVAVVIKGGTAFKLPP